LNILFRADASLEIGTGHVMRCLTLSDALSQEGAQVQFICREHKGNLIAHIRSKGYPVHVLKIIDSIASADLNSGRAKEDSLFHAQWLGSTQEQDARACKQILQKVQPDWLIVDHYSIDKNWQEELQGTYKRLMVIDDLADRYHLCNLLLDQNLGHTEDVYSSLVPENCVVLAGPKYALLRPEFAAIREYSIQRRIGSKLDRLLVTLGGVDQPNATSEVLEALKDCSLPESCQISVVMGEQSPWLDQVRLIAAAMPWQTKVLVNIDDMAKVMASSDLAIGAAGSTAWERCCLGLPSLLIVLTKNQRSGALALQDAGAACLLGGVSKIRSQLPKALIAISLPNMLAEMVQHASNITDGQGTSLVIQQMKSLV